MSVETLFYGFGIVLVLAALVISFVGIRSESSFPSRAAFGGLLTILLVLVVGTGAYAVMLAREEKEHREHELAAQDGHAAEEEGASVQEPPPAEEDPSSDQAPPAAEALLGLTSPLDGSLLFEPDALSSAPGEITIAYENPSPVPHNVAVEDEGEVLGESETIANAETELTLELAPGQYVFFCTIPGHRENGMEGDLLVEQ